MAQALIAQGTPLICEDIKILSTMDVERQEISSSQEGLTLFMHCR